LIISKIYKELKKFTPPKSMTQWTQQSFFKRSPSFQKQTNKKTKTNKQTEEMLNIPGHKGIANDSHTKIPLHSC
jgi:hypothetical protein